MQLQSWRNKFYQMHKNTRLLIIILLLKALLIIFFIAANYITLKNEADERIAIHKYLVNLFKKTNKNNDVNAELIWSNETVELFQDKLGLTLMIEKSADAMKIKCENVFMLSALPGSEEDNFYESLWQYFSMDALEQMTIICDDSGKKLTLRPVVTERIKFHLESVFEGLPLDMITSYPSSCYDLTYTKIIGNISPIELKEIEKETPFLLDPAVKRWREISQRWAVKVRPFWKFKKNILKDVEPEFTITHTLVGARDNDINYVGVYVTNNDALPTDYYKDAITFYRKNSVAIFIVICDVVSLKMCRDLFENAKNPHMDDARVVRASTNAFDFALLASCNSSIISNDMGVLHALIHGGMATVFSHKDAEHYVPFLMSERMENWYAISVDK